jgi:hypothetical protein
MVFYLYTKDTEPQGRLWYGDLEPCKIPDQYDKKELFIMPELMSGSDSVGCTVNKSNANTFLREHGKQAGIFDVFGGYGTYAVVIIADVAEQEGIKDVLDALENYPVIDDDDRYTQEADARDEAWSNYAEKDVTNTIENYLLETLDIEWEAPENLRQLFDETQDEACEYWSEETGGNMFIRAEKIATFMADDIIATLAPVNLLPLLLTSRKWKSESAKQKAILRMKG